MSDFLLKTLASAAAMLSFRRVLQVMVLLGCATANAQSFALHMDDCVVFYGDSITAQRFYTKFAEEFVLTRYPALNVRFVNAGVPGDTVNGGYAGTMPQRVAAAANACKPIMLGMNDGGWGYTAPEKMHADFTKGYAALMNAWRTDAPAASMTLINPTPYDEITHGTDFPGYSSLVAQLSDDVTAMASGAGQRPGTMTYRADFAAPVSRALQSAKAHDPQLASLLIPDRIHPAEITHWIMAAALLRAWNVDPLVGNVVFDGAQGTVRSTYRTSVSGLVRKVSGLQWEQLDEALPLPLDLNNTMTSVVLENSDVAAVDRQMLSATGLPEGTYQLLIDRKPVGAWTSEELARGVNLALVKTPMLDQAGTVAWLENRRMTVDDARFILGAEVKADASPAATQNELARAEDQIAATIREKLLLTKHSFELRRQ